VMLVFVAVFCLLTPPAATSLTRSCREERAVTEEIHQRRLSEASELPEKLSFYLPQCDDEGNWKALQKSSDNQRWCVDTETGDVISKKSDQLISCTGCLASKLIIEMSIERAGLARAKISNVFIPECQDEFPERYEELQCWNGYFNACWCVNATTGEATSFPSSTEDEMMCRRNKFNQGAVTWCQVLRSLTSSYYSVYETVKLWRHGGTDVSVNVKPEVTIEVHCDKHGRFAEEQCVGEDCWCVEPTTGRVTSECARHRAKRSLYSICQENRVQQLEAYYEFVSIGVMLEHFTIPKCTNLGQWDEIQCSNQTVDGEKTCWCVDQTTGTRTTNASSALKSCDSCRAHRLRAIQANITDFTACDETGQYYTVIQCNDENKQCWCVDHVTGKVLRSSRHGDVTGVQCERDDRHHNMKNRN